MSEPEVGVGGEDAVALVRGHVQDVEGAGDAGRDGECEQRQGWPRRQGEEPPPRRMERRGNGDHGTGDQEPFVSRERTRREIGERCGGDLLHSGNLTCEQPDRDHDPRERPVADVAHLGALVEHPGTEQVDGAEADRERGEREQKDQ